MLGGDFSPCLEHKVAVSPPSLSTAPRSSKLGEASGLASWEGMGRTPVLVT